MMSGLRVFICAGATALCALTLWNNFAFAQVRMYDVQWTTTTPTIDGTIGVGEWAAAGPAQGGWSELRQPVTDLDTANNRFQMMWDANGLYILYQVNQATWLPPLGPGNPDISFGDDNLNVYFDPNTDNDPNFATDPDELVDGYQVAFNQYLGTLISTNADRQGVGFFTEAHAGTIFGDQGNWNLGGSAVGGAAMQGMVVAQNNGGSGGLAEMFIPWTNFNADAAIPPTGDYNRNGTVDAADYPLWRDTLGMTVDPAGSGADGDGNGTVEQADYTVWSAAFGTIGSPGTNGLFHPMAPSNTDTWFFQMGQITNADPNNFLPVYNWTSSQFFAARPHAEITFVGQPAPAGGAAVPEPASIVLVTLAAIGLAALIRRK